MLLISVVAAFGVSGIGGWVCGRLGNRRRVWLVGWLLAPVAVYTAWLASLPPGEESFFFWWLVGLAYLSIPLGVWTIGAVAGFGISKLKDQQP